MKIIKIFFVFVGLILCNNAISQNKKAVDELFERHKLVIVNHSNSVDEVIEERKEFLYNKAEKATNKRELEFALRYFTPVKNYGIYPDNAYYSRTRYFKPTDLLLPFIINARSKIAVVKDFSGKIPDGAVIDSINGHGAEELRKLHKYVLNNTPDHDNFYAWNNFPNFLFMENILPPYTIVYSLNGNKYNANIEGMERKELGNKHKKFRKSK